MSEFNHSTTRSERAQIRRDRVAREARETELVRALVRALDDDTLLAIEKALHAQAAVLDVVATAVPEQREDANRLRAATPLFVKAVVRRDWIEGREA